AAASAPRALDSCEAAVVSWDMRCARMLPLVVALGAARAAGPGEHEALVAQENGIRAFNAGRLAEGRAAFEEAHRLAPDKANPYRWLGMTEARLGDCAAAIRDLDSFLRLIPPRDPRIPEAVTVRDRCRADLQPQLGSLAVESAPPGA